MCVCDVTSRPDLPDGDSCECCCIYLSIYMLSVVVSIYLSICSIYRSICLGAVREVKVGQTANHESVVVRRRLEKGEEHATDPVFKRYALVVLLVDERLAYVYIYICMYVYTYVCMYVYTYVCM